MNPSDDGPLTDEDIRRIHNVPENKELGPCTCPVCRPLMEHGSLTIEQVQGAVNRTEVAKYDLV